MDGGFPAKLRMQLSYNKEHNVYALVVNGNSESDMVRLTREHKFPRGCIIFWVPKTFITIRGFFPKFQNDGESNLSGTNWKNIDKVENLFVWIFTCLTVFFLSALHQRKVQRIPHPSRGSDDQR